MELRHLRYFIAVAEEGSLSNAAERRLHTAQPSLSRQIRDLEIELGVKLLERRARGIALTAAGKVFLDHARLALMQIEAAAEAARQAEQPKEPAFVVGFLIGQEVTWLPHTLRILREEAPDIDIMIFSRTSPKLALALMRGNVDVAFLRNEKHTSGIAFRLLIKEPLMVILPTGHRLAARKAIPPHQLAREKKFIHPAKTAPVLRSVINDYAEKVGITLKSTYEAENLSALMSLVESSGGVGLAPLYVKNMLIPSVVARPLQGESPTIDLMMGYNKSNTTPLLKRFLSRADEIVEHVSQKENLLSAKKRKIGAA
jgi:LysR family hca operon transcriptional activator